MKLRRHVLPLGFVAAACLLVSAGPALAVVPEGVPHAPVVRPAPTAQPRLTLPPRARRPVHTACTGRAYGGQVYCFGSPATIVAGGYPGGSRLVLSGVSVTAVRSGAVTIAWYSNDCRPGVLCGALLTRHQLDLSWTGAAPVVPSVVDAYGIVAGANFTVVAFLPGQGCHVDDSLCW